MKIGNQELNELKARLAEEFDEITLVELLEINSYDIVEGFPSKIEGKFFYLKKELDNKHE